MRKLNRWNCEEHEYKSYFVPDDWDITTYETDMNKIINCAECGKKIKFGDSYTSKLIHTNAGMGFCVCRKCQDKEWKEYQKNKEV